MPRMIGHPTLALDEVRHAPSGPQARVIPQGFRPPLQAALNPVQISLAHARLTTRPPGLRQPGPPARGHLLRPTIHRLPVHAHAAGDFGFAQAALQQPRRAQAPALQGIKVSSHAGGVSHASSIADRHGFVTILYESH